MHPSNPMKWFLQSSAVFILLSCLGYAQIPTTPSRIRVDKKSADAYLKGIALFQNKKYSEAIPYFKESGKNKDLFWRSELRMGICHFYLEQFRQASRKFTKIIDGMENRERDVIYAAQFYYGSVHFLENRLDLAEFYLQEARGSSQQPVIVKEAEALLKEIALFKQDPAYQATKKYSASGYLSEQLGYDTNANITQNGTGSLFNRAMGILMVDAPAAWNVTGGLQYFGSNTLYLNQAVTTFDSLIHGPSVYVTYPFNPDHSLSLNHKLGATWYSTRSNNAFSVLTSTAELLNTAIWVPETNTAWIGSMTLQSTQQNKDTTAQLNSTGIVFGLGLGYRLNLEATLPRSMNVGIRGQYYIYSGSQSEYYEAALSGGYLYSFYEDWRGELSLNGRYSFYPKHANQRADTQITANLSSTWSALSWLDVGPSLTIETNSSNVDTSRYFRFSAFINANLFRTISL